MVFFRLQAHFQPSKVVLSTTSKLGGMAKKTTTKTPRKDKISHARPLAVAKPKFDELLRLVSKPKGGKKK
jgi:hypothetical protein